MPVPPSGSYFPQGKRADTKYEYNWSTFVNYSGLIGIILRNI